MYITLTAVAPLLSLLGNAESRAVRGSHGVNKNWAGVNSFFLHAFPEYVLACTKHITIPVGSTCEGIMLTREL